jgi:hypothetical protein
MPSTIAHKVLRSTVCGLIALVAIGCGGSDPSSGSVEAPTLLDSTPFGGSLSISGTVSLPDSAVAGKAISLEVNRLAGGNDLTRDSTQTTSAKTVKYVVSGVTDGDYEIRLRVDVTGNMQFSDPGDFDGFYRGSVAMPALSSSTGSKITVAGASLTAVDFGIGVVK